MVATAAASAASLTISGSLLGEPCTAAGNGIFGCRDRVPKIITKIRTGDQKKRLYSLVLPRWAAESPTAWAAWRWTKPSDRSRFEKATRSQRYLRCRP